MIWTPPTSTPVLVENWSLGRDDPLSWAVEQLVLRRIVDTRICPLCDVGDGGLCRVYGGYESLRRTHWQRLKVGRGELRSAIKWAQAEAERRLLENEDVAIEGIEFDVA